MTKVHGARLADLIKGEGEEAVAHEALIERAEALFSFAGAHRTAPDLSQPRWGV